MKTANVGSPVETPLYTIETDITPEEIAMVDEAMEEYYKDPDSWVSLADL
jgi:hypothetical protein